MARKILNEASKKQGLNKLQEYKTYSFIGTDKWRGVLGNLGKLWPNAEARFQMHLVSNSFDGQLKFLDGKREGNVVGLQSDNYYEKRDGEYVFVKTDKRNKFGINAYQYFFELAERLSKAELVTMGGTAEMDGQEYDLVFCTWKQLRTHKQNDQYLAWINKENGLLEFCQFTIHDPYLVGGSMLVGSIAFEDFREIGGVKIPFTQCIYSGKPKSTGKGYLHRLTLETFSFDQINHLELKPNKDLPHIGDEKPL
ncbi:MAG: hypothetical protein MRY83_22820 [Flavobacteriales bacterium]|nr:hypothetical protein [Flavobacteriales bacterium]